MSTELKAFELSAKVEQKAIVSYDKEGIENYVAAVENKYQGLVFTEEATTEAKEERAKLNKLKDNIDTFRKNITGELTSDINLFDTDFKNYAARIAKVSKDIDEQVKVFEKNEEKKRLEKSKEFMQSLVKMRDQYTEFLPQLLDLVDQNKIFALKGSYTEKGEIAKKLADFIDQELMKYDEILAARKAAEELLKQKRELIVSQCTSMTEMFELKIPLSPKTFGYLKDYELTAITTEIQRVAKEQSVSEKEAVEKIRIEEERKATIKAQEEVKKQQVAEPVIEEATIIEEPKDIKTQENVEQVNLSKETTANILEKKVYGSIAYDGGVLNFEGCELELAKKFKKFFVDNNLNYEIIKQEVR